MTIELENCPAAGDNRAVSLFVDKLRGTYDVSETILFGSRARRDNRPDSDLDLAVVLNGKRGNFIETKLDMAGLAFDVLMETGILVQALPMWEGDLAHPEQFPNPASYATSCGKAYGLDDDRGHGQGAEGTRIREASAGRWRH